jgi:hypothetical protein
MRSLLRAAVRGLFVALLATAHGARAFKDYQVMAFFENSPLGADLAALLAAQSLFDSVVQWLLTCDILEPGQLPPNRNRELAAELEQAVDVEVDSSLRGGRTIERRDKSAFSCPNSCTNSGSTKCRSLGCAFCGKCRRELTNNGTSGGLGEFTLSSSNALKIENTFNSGLKHFCLFRSRCRIYVKIYRIEEDGTAIPLTGT